MRRAARSLLPLLALAAGVLLAGGLVPSGATPRYAARYEQSCQLCHDDPSGGGKRSLYAAQYLWPVEMVTFPPAAETLERLDPRLGGNVSAGCDLRTIYHDSSAEGGAQGFFQMEGNLYLSIDPDPRYSLYLTRGVSGSYEVFGLARVLPARGYLKVGRFVPPYGWRLADHTAFVREQGGFQPPAHSDVGVEAGLYPGRFSLQLAAVNGARGSLRDDDGELAASGLALGRFRLAGFSCAAGASFSASPRDAAGERRSGGGPFGSLSWGPLTWVGEMDWLQRERAGERPDATGWTISQEWSGRIERGCDLIVTHDFHDPDLDRASGARERWGAGAEWRPAAFVQIRAIVLRDRIDAGPALAGEDSWLTEGQVHFLY